MSDTVLKTLHVLFYFILTMVLWSWHYYQIILWRMRPRAASEWWRDGLELELLILPSLTSEQLVSHVPVWVVDKGQHVQL